MDNKSDNEKSIMAAVSGHNLLVKVKGDASFGISPAFKQMGLAAVGRNAHRIIVDMRECTGVDSTFVGMLAGLSGKLKGGGGGITLVNVTPKVEDVLQTLGLNVLVEIHSGASDDSIEWPARMIPVRIQPPADDAATRHTILEAHESLARISKENLDRFKDVIEELWREENQ